ncbi:MAG: hypothetical protein U0Q16_39285 [Bryobacteraceae bacterium]
MFRFLVVAALVLQLAGCGSNANNKDAIRQAVVEHLSGRKGLDLNMSAMDVEVTSVTFRDREADAVVDFKAKGSSASMMTMKYTLERSGDKWTVKAKKDSNNPHGGGMGSSSGGELPAGHPATPAPGASDPGAVAPEGHKK